MGLISKTPMNLVHQFLIRIPKPNLKSNKGEENKTEKDKEGKQTHSRLGLLGPRQSASPTGLPTPPLPVCPEHARGPRAGPARRARPRALRFACCRCLPSPTHQLFPVHLLHATLNRPRDQGPTAVAGAGQGVTPGAWPCSPMRRGHTTLCHRRMRPMPLHRTIPDAVGGMVLG